jgi:PPP family 3-phenylpropionic acid transporter
VSLPVRFALFYVATFLFVGVYVPFWPVWLASRGLSAEEIAVVVAVTTWLRAIGPPLVADAADRRGERWRVIIGLLVATLLSYPLFALAEGLWPILAVTVLTTLVHSSIFPLVDNLVMLSAHERGFDYGRVRLWGSLSFIAAAAGSGALIATRSPDLLLWLMVGVIALALCTAVPLPRTRPPPARSVRGPARTLLANRVILVFLACVGLIQASHAAYYGFGTLHWRAAGYSEEVIGALWAEGVVVEIVLFAFSGAIVARLGPKALLAAAIAAAIARWTVTGATTHVVALVLAQALHGLTFGAAHIAAMHFLLRAVPVELSGTAQSLYAGPGVAVTTGIAVIVAGWLFPSGGGSAFYAMTATAILAGVAWLALVRSWDGGRLAGLGGAPGPVAAR